MSEAALKLSKQFRDMAGAVWEATLAASREGKMDAFAVRRIQVEVYQPLLAHALDIAVQDALATQQGLDALVDEVSSAADDLEEGLDRVKVLENAVAFGLMLVPAVASVVAFVAAPNPATAGAAVAAIGKAAGKLPT
jgi:hypothetical protein